MGFRFFKRVKILPGVTLNLGKGVPSVSVGPRGAKATIGAKGISSSLGIPGTGASYQKKLVSWGSGGSKPSSRSTAKTASSRTSRAASTPAPAPQANTQSDYEKLNFGFFAKLTLSKEEKAMAKGVQACLINDFAGAEPHLKQALPLPDAAFTLGTVYLNMQRYEEAEKLFALAEQTPNRIGEFYQKYALGMTFHLAISSFYEADFPPCMLVSYLSHVEMLQQLKRCSDACKLLLDVQKRFPDNLDVIISLADIVLENEPDNEEWMNTLVNTTKNLENDSYAHAVLLMYKAEAFDNLGMTDAAITTLTNTMRKKADRPKEFLLELQYQRGVLYQKSGKNAQALKDFNAVYAEDPTYANVAQLIKQLNAN
ncbi:MAG: DUF4236 domain-containing protein [Victivallales bacterium]|nr:DUF4236 domain-containing protein [Victivallales bacterium]